MTWPELRELRVDGREPIPLMADLFERFSDVRFNIDCKSDAAAPALIQLVHDRDAINRICIGSFSHARLLKLRAILGPELLTCMSPQEIARLRLLGRVSGDAQRVAQVPVRAGRRTGPRGITVVTERFVTTAHRNGVAVHVWTIDEPDEMHRLLDLGVDGIMTDRPEVLRSVLLERGQWTVDPTGPVT